MTKLILSTIFAVPLIAACTADQVTDQATEPATSALTPGGHEMQAVATVVSPTGTTIEFFAVSSGGYFALEHGDVGQDAVLTHDDIAMRSVAEVYRKATGKQAVPSAIAALSDHVLATDAASPALAVNRLASPSSTPAQFSGTHTTASGGSCSSSYFTSHDGCETGAARTWCLLDWWNGAYEYTSQTDLSFASICADIGSVMWQIQNGDGGFHQISVLEGQWYNYSLHDGGQTWLHYDVLQASGHRFQFGGEMYSY